MNRLTTLDINKLTPYAVGFDRVFDDMFKYIEHNTSSTGYPPYNIIRDGEKFQIEIALAGVDKKDLEITVAEGVLTVEHKPAGEQDLGNSWDWIHKGIAQRNFKRNFTLSDDIVVQGSRMENGMLYIELERIIPEEKKPKTIAIK
jgi:molecular chaperone IbpA|tara:strand:+ start:33 stop:467 length:435 start_codon:yes stop_codon:yes gene_type:complete